MTANMVKEYTLGRMAVSMTDPGSTESNTERVSTDKQMEKKEKDIGKRASALSGSTRMLMQVLPPQCEETY